MGMISQLSALLRKNGLLLWRSRSATGLQLAAPILCIVLVSAVGWVVNTKKFDSMSAADTFLPKPELVGAIPDCRDDVFLRHDDCISFVYAPGGHPMVEAVVDGIRRHNMSPISPSQVVGLPSLDAMDQWLMDNPGKALGGLYFATDNINTNTSIRFVVQSNSTVKLFKGHFQDPNYYFQLPLQLAVERESFRFFHRQQKQGRDGEYNGEGRAASAEVSDGFSAPVGEKGNSSSGSPFQDLDWNVAFQDYPQPLGAAGDPSGSSAITYTMLAPFIFAAAMMNFGITMSAILNEKESGLKRMLKGMGMRTTPYWMSWWICHVLMAAWTSLLLCFSGRAMGLAFFKYNDFSVLFCLFFLFESAMISLSYLSSSAISQARTATHFSFSMFIIGWICQIVVSFGFPYTVDFKEDAYLVYLGMSVLPWDLLCKAVVDLGKAAEAASVGSVSGITWQHRYSYCTGGESHDGGYGAYKEEGAQHSLLDLHKQQEVSLHPQPFRMDQCVMPIGEVLEWLLALHVVMLVLAVGTEIAKDQVAMRRRPGPRSATQHSRDSEASTDPSSSSQAAGNGTNNVPGSKPCCIDPAVHEEELKMRQAFLAWLAGGRRGQQIEMPSGVEAAQTRSHGGHDMTIEIPMSSFSPPTRHQDSTPSHEANGATASGRRSSSIDDGEGGITSSTTDDTGSQDGQRDSIQIFGIMKRFRNFQAVKSLWYSMKRGEVFCLLGENGAGKTTSINVLTGNIPASRGVAVVEGYPISSPAGLQKLRSIMGICPQFDMLWPKLTAREHLEICLAIKGMCGSSEAPEAHIERLLGHVGLLPVADVTTKCFSGGMQRRLSVAIAFLGNPKVVFLDEPTTGMDPINRRHIWSFIQSSKHEKAIVLTTHSLEEADVLGDRIGIMASGAMQSIGSSLSLKRKFGAGYRVVVGLAANPGDGHYDDPSSMRKRKAAIWRAVLERVMVLMSMEDNGYTLQFRVQRGADGALCSVLEQLESHSDMWGISSIDVSLPSLEEVFLEVSEAAAANKASKPSIDIEK